MSIIQSVPWRVQPQTAARVSPYWPASGFAFVGGQVGDAATRRMWTLGSTASQGVDSYGRATSPGTAGNSITQAGISAAAQTKCTFVCVFRIDTGREYSFIARTSTSNSGFALGNGTGNSGGLSYGLHKGGVATLSEVVLTAGVTYVMVASHDQASGEYYVVARPIRGGATLRASGTNTTASSAGSGTASIGINASPNDFIGSVGLVWQAFEFLPEAHSGALLANPWQLFAPLPRRIWAPAAAGGAYTITADAGAYTLAGQDATLLKTRIVTADAGSYALGGQDASVLVGHKLAADAGAYSVAGQDATLTYVPVTPGAYTLTCDAGAYAIAGQDATLLRGRVVAADAGDYLLTGGAATFAYSGGQPQGGGGWLPKMRRKTRKELHAERVRLGILPPDVVKAAKKAAAVVLDEPSPVKAYRADPEAANKVFLRELGATKMLPDYRRAIQIQIELQHQEDEDLMLFF